MEARTYFAIQAETMLLLHGECGENDGEDVASRRLQDYRRRGLGSMENEDV